MCPENSSWRITGVTCGFAVALIVSAVLPARAQQAGQPIQRHLANGLRVVVQGNDHTATVVVAAMVNVTALHEPRDATGIRQLTQSMLASGQGCRQTLREAAIRAEGSVAPDYAELSLAAPADSLEECITLLRRMLFRPTLTGETLEPLRDRLVRTLAAREEVPAPLAVNRLYQAIYPGIRSGDTAAGDPVEVASISVDDVRRFHAKHYLPNATIVGISGGIDATEALGLVEETMSVVLPGALPSAAPEPQASRPSGTDEIEVGGGTSVFAIGGRAVALDSPQYPAMATGMALLGSGMDSRLYRALRVDRALAYTIAAELTPSATAPSGIVLVTCDPNRLDEVQQAVERQISRVLQSPAGSEELRRAKRYLIGKQALRRQRNREVAHYLAMFELLGGPLGYRLDGQLAGEIASVDGDEVARAMRTLFRPAWSVRLRASGNGAN